MELMGNMLSLRGQMQLEKSHYIQTLLKAEDQGLCKGIKRRMDPSVRYKLQQQLAKYRLV